MNNLLIVESPDGFHRVFVNNTELRRIDDDTVYLSRDLGYGLTIKELEEIPYGIHITADDHGTNIEPVSTIIDYQDDCAVVAIITMHISGFVQAISEYSYSEYILAMRKAVLERHDLQMNPRDLAEPEFDIDTFIVSENNGIQYSHIGPFEFCSAIPAPTYGDLILQIESLMFELEQRALYFLENNMI